jgi:hypothetical protein
MPGILASFYHANVDGDPPPCSRPPGLVAAGHPPACKKPDDAIVSGARTPSRNNRMV